jgi:hydrogenase/urease accessory protein HupE
MVHNLPTVLLLLRTWALVILCLLTTTAAQAHPGHDGHEEGDGFTWTLDHLSRHPWATTLCIATIGFLAWAVARHLTAKQRQTKAAATGSPAAGTLS